MTNSVSQPTCHPHLQDILFQTVLTGNVGFYQLDRSIFLRLQLERWPFFSIRLSRDTVDKGKDFFRSNVFYTRVRVEGVGDERITANMTNSHAENRVNPHYCPETERDGKQYQPEKLKDESGLIHIIRIGGESMFKKNSSAQLSSRGYARGKGGLSINLSINFFSDFVMFFALT